MKIDPCQLLRLGHGLGDYQIEDVWGKAGRVNYVLERRLELLEKVNQLAQSMGIPGDHGATCETAGYFFFNHVETVWNSFSSNIKSLDDVKTQFPFNKLFSSLTESLFSESQSFEEAKDEAQTCFRYITNLFAEIRRMKPFEILKSGQDRSDYLLMNEARIVAVTSAYLGDKRQELIDLGYFCDSAIIEDASQMLEIEAFIPLTIQPSGEESRLKRCILIGDNLQLRPDIRTDALSKYSAMNQSLYERLTRLGVPFVELDIQESYRPCISKLFKDEYTELNDSSTVFENDYLLANPGFLFEYQIVNVPDFGGQGEYEPRPKFFQNLGEAEYAVALFQYMRLKG
jgi:intron-binding protein aquarius